MVNTQEIAKLEMQMCQLANHLGERDKGKLPSQPVSNPMALAIGIFQVLRRVGACVGNCHIKVRETNGQSSGGARSRRC
jgi:hypothetical protein